MIQHIKAPLTKDEISKLHAGDYVYISQRCGTSKNL